MKAFVSQKRLFFLLKCHFFENFMLTNVRARDSLKDKDIDVSTTLRISHIETEISDADKTILANGVVVWNLVFYMNRMSAEATVKSKQWLRNKNQILNKITVTIG
jgi:hypothetical protein